MMTLGSTVVLALRILKLETKELQTEDEIREDGIVLIYWQKVMELGRSGWLSEREIREKEAGIISYKSEEFLTAWRKDSWTAGILNRKGGDSQGLNKKFVAFLIPNFCPNIASPDVRKTLNKKSQHFSLLTTNDIQISLSFLRILWKSTQIGRKVNKGEGLLSLNDAECIKTAEGTAKRGEIKLEKKRRHFSLTWADDFFSF